MKAYEVVLRHVEEAILAGQLSVGDLLPPERELAQQLGVSRSATREAIRALEAQGVLTSSVGAGPGSGTRVTDQQSKALTKLLRLQVALANFPVGDVVELRVALERVSVTSPRSASRSWLCAACAGCSTRWPHRPWGWTPSTSWTPSSTS